MKERYSRQELYPGVGKKGQNLLGKATIAIVGIGALGSTSAELLARAGVGKLILIDRDFVEESNLQRQHLFDESDIGHPKALRAKDHLLKINSTITIQSHIDDLNFRTIDSLLKEVDIIVDGTDNLETRHLINEYSMKHHVPWVYGSAISDRGFVGVFFGKQPCFRCFSSTHPIQETCDTVGVLNSITTIIGSLQAQMTIDILLGKELASFIHINLHNYTFSTLKLINNARCEVCLGSYPSLSGKNHQSIIKICSSGPYQILTPHSFNLSTIKKRLNKIGKTVDLGYCLVFKNMKIFTDRVLIQASTEHEAKALYAKYLGA